MLVVNQVRSAINATLYAARCEPQSELLDEKGLLWKPNAAQSFLGLEFLALGLRQASPLTVNARPWPGHKPAWGNHLPDSQFSFLPDKPKALDLPCERLWVASRIRINSGLSWEEA